MDQLTHSEFIQACRLMRKHGHCGVVVLDLKNNLFMVCSGYIGDIVPVYTNDNYVR